MSIQDIWDKSAEIAAAIDGIATAYPGTPQVPPADIMLPAILHGAPLDGSGLEFDIHWGASLEEWTYNWSLLLLVKMDGDMQRDLDEILPLLQPIIAAYRNQLTFGIATVYGAHPTGGKIQTVRFLDATFLGCEFRWTAKEKLSATFSVT